MEIFLINLIRLFFFFPSTILHEISHYIFAKICGHYVERFDIFPKFKNLRLETEYLGCVVSRPKIGFTFFIVGLAPLVLLIPLYFLFKVSPYLDIVLTTQYFSLGVDKGLFVNTDGLLTLYGSIQLLNAAIPSRTDIIVAVKALIIRPFAIY
jgi:hypothetical protein